MNAQEAALELTDYVLGRLDRSRHEAVAAAVAVDPELQELEAWIRQVQQILRVAGEAILGHPDADDLVTFALTPDTADPAIGAHAVSCSVCRGYVEATRATSADLAGPDRSSRVRLREALAAWRRGRPVALGAAAALVVLLVGGPLVRAPSTLPAGATRTLHVAASVRSVDPAHAPVNVHGIAALTMLVEVDPYIEAANENVAVRFRLLRDGRPVHTWSGMAQDVWNPGLGVMSFLVPTTTLAPGDHELLVDLDGVTVLQRTIRVDH